jgi:uncharacterized protein YecT (DUF1311 family)
MKKILLLLLLCSFSGFAQTIDEVDALKKEHEECLDQLENLVGCSVTYYDKTNLLFDKVFRNVRDKSTSEQKKKLKEEQFLWLKKKTTYFDKVYKDTAAELGTDEGDDFRMTVNAKKADFVNERILELIKQLENTSQQETSPSVKK